jgi:hypothetical protein
LRQETTAFLGGGQREIFPLGKEEEEEEREGG